MKIISVVGARPNFMKIAPFIQAIESHNKSSNKSHIEHILVHTGQHYDDRMSKQFFDNLNIPEADINLGIGSGSHAYQVGMTMIEFEKVLKSEKPDWVVVLGDVNATLACSVTAKKEHIKVCHIEAGLRSGDITMPEEVNRLVTDRLCDLLLTPDEISNKNLEKEGTSPNRVRFVGNIMIDTLESNREKASNLDIDNVIKLNVHREKSNSILIENKDFVTLTIHRPSNVDEQPILKSIVDFLLTTVVENSILVWPIHPRTEKQLKKFRLWEQIIAQENLILLNPLGYHEMLKLNMGSKIMLTDSGGLQEECTVLGTPCITLRANTERPITLTKHGGASILVGNDIHLLKTEYNLALKMKRNPVKPPFWDGVTGQRCLNALIEFDF